MLKAASALWRKRRNHTYLLYRENLSTWRGVAEILSLATILAILALSFDSGISQKVISQAQNAAPLDVSLRTGPALIRPLDIGGTGDYEKLLAGSRAYPVLRTATTIRNLSLISDSLSLIGLSPEAVAAMSEPKAHNLTSILTTSIPSNEVGINTRSYKGISVRLSGIPKEIDLIGWFRTPRGTHISRFFGGHGDVRSLVLSGQIPPGSSLIAFDFRETSDYLSRRLHAIGEGNFAIPILTGVASIVNATFDGIPQPFPERIWHLKNFPYAFEGNDLYVRPAIAKTIPFVVVDPATASEAKNGLLTLSGAGKSYFQVRVGAVRKSFPSAGNRFAIMNLTLLQNEIANVELGTMDPIEIWISTPDAKKFLEKLSVSHLQGLEVQSQAAVKKELYSDPFNVGLSASYKIVVLFSLILALFMYVSALPLLYREGRGVLFQLEASGLGPILLRRSLREALRLTVTVALSLGTATGLLLARFFISNSTPWIKVGVALFTSIVLSEVCGYLVTRRFFVQPTLVGR